MDWVDLPGAYASLPESGVQVQLDSSATGLVSIEVEPRIHIFLVFVSVHMFWNINIWKFYINIFLRGGYSPFSLV